MIDTDFDVIECTHPRTDYRVIEYGARMVWSCASCGDGGVTHDTDPVRLAPTDDEEATYWSEVGVRVIIRTEGPWAGERVFLGRNHPGAPGVDFERPVRGNRLPAANIAELEMLQRIADARTLADYEDSER